MMLGAEEGRCCEGGRVGFENSATRVAVFHPIPTPGCNSPHTARRRRRRRRRLQAASERPNLQRAGRQTGRQTHTARGGMLRAFQEQKRGSERCGLQGVKPGQLSQLSKTGWRQGALGAVRALVIAGCP
jgi:hypothetical protein